MSKKKILVVDDDESLRDILKIKIESAGYEFLSATDGKQMLNAIKTRKPDAIILDIMLPELDGYSALREMKKQREFEDIPVIILTAKEKQKVADLFMLEKIAFFVEKPYEVEDLLQKIRGLVK